MWILSRIVLGKRWGRHLYLGEDEEQVERPQGDEAAQKALFAAGSDGVVPEVWVMS